MRYDFNKNYVTSGYYIPERMMYGIEKYIKNGILPGHFLQKVICNDLQGVVAHGDSENLENIVAYVRFFYNEVTQDCWGTEEKMKAWVKKGGLGVK